MIVYVLCVAFREARQSKKVYLLPFFHEGVELTDASKSEFVHEINNVGGGKIFLFKSLYCHRESGGEQADLSICWAFRDQRLKCWRVIRNI